MSPELANRVRKVRKRIKNSRRYKTVQVKTAVAVLGITSLSSREAAPEHLATLRPRALVHREPAPLGP